MANKKKPPLPGPDDGSLPEPVGGQPVEPPLPEPGPTPPVPDDSSESGGSAVGSEGAAPADDETPIDELIEAEGPDVETSFSDADLSFLSGQSSAEQLAAERLADLQRVTADYANYRRRTEENREVERERSIGGVVSALLPVLDDLDLAEKHGDLEEGKAFTTITAKLRASMERLGLKAFGAAGDAFDHNVHEAIFQQPNPDVDSETVADVVQTGYFLGSTLLRAAKVVVSVPEDPNG